MNNLWRALCVTVFVTGVISFSQIPERDKKQIEPPVPYTAIYSHYRVGSDGTKMTTGVTRKQVKSDGQWRETRFDPARSSSSADQADVAKRSPVYASTDEGVIAKAPGQDHSKYISQAADQQMQECFRSERCLRGQSTFVRMDEVAGLKVYVLRTQINVPDNPTEWVEESYSPKTGYLPLRHVTHFHDGSEMVTEATHVEFSDVPDNLNDDLKKLPIKGRNSN